MYDVPFGNVVTHIYDKIFLSGCISVAVHCTMSLLARSVPHLCTTNDIKNSALSADMQSRTQTSNQLASVQHQQAREQ